MLGFLQDPEKLKLLMMGAGLLSHDPRQPANFGQDLQRGLLGGMQVDQMSAERQRQKQQDELHQMRLAQAKREEAQQQGLMDLAQRSQREVMPGDGMGPPSLQFDQQAFAQGLMGIDPMKGMALQSQLAQLNKPEFMSVAPGASVIDKRNPAQPVFTAPAEPKDWQNPAYQEFKLREAAARRPQVTVDTRQESEFAKKMGGNFAEQFDGILKGGVAAQDEMRTLQRFENIIAKVPTGKLEPLKTEVGRLGASLGIKVDTQKLGFQESLEALSNQFALTLRNPGNGAGMPGALSDKDREFLVSMVPGLSKTPEGNRLIVEAMKRVSQRKAEVARLAREYKTSTGKFDEGFYDVLERRFGGQDLLGDLYQQASGMAPSGFRVLGVEG